MKKFNFSLQKKVHSKTPCRAGVIRTPHGDIETPAFIVVGTKATVKALTTEQVKDLGAEAILANTYHLFLEPGDELVREAGGLGKFMHWDGPTFTDSGGFQVFSLGAAYGKGINKIGANQSIPGLLPTDRIEGSDPSQKKKMWSGDDGATKSDHAQPAKVDEDGVTFRSHIDGSSHRLTPERSIQIQHNLGTDILFVFDECTSPQDSYEKQKVSLDRTHRWAIRSLAKHRALASQKSVEQTLKNAEERQRARGFAQTERENIQNEQLPLGRRVSKSAHLETRRPSGSSSDQQALFGIVQGGRFQGLREESARIIGAMDFDGFGIGGSFTKEDIGTAVKWVNTILPEEKPRHLLGIGEPVDIFLGVENGVDTFDCVAPTRMGRNGGLYTADGRIAITNAKFISDFRKIENDCECYTCQNFTRAYLAHLFRAKEMIGATLASIHNLYFIVNLVKKIRQSILDGRFMEYKQEVLSRYGAPRSK